MTIGLYCVSFIRTFNETDLCVIKTEFITEFQVDKNMINAEMFYVNNNNKVCIMFTRYHFPMFSSKHKTIWAFFSFYISSLNIFCFNRWLLLSLKSEFNARLITNKGCHLIEKIFTFHKNPNYSANWSQKSFWNFALIAS